MLLVSLFSFNSLITSAAEQCSCVWGGNEEEGYSYSVNWDNCGSCSSASCNQGSGACSCVSINRDYSSYACINCGGDSTSGDNGIGYGSSLFGQGTPQCCGDDTNEYFLIDSSYSACCNELSDCARATGSCLNSQFASGTKLCVSGDISLYATDKFVGYDPNEELAMGACGVGGSWDTTCDCDDYEDVCEAAIGCGGDWINWYETPSEQDICCTGAIQLAYERLGDGSWDGESWDCGTMELGWCGECFCGIPW